MQLNNTYTCKYIFSMLLVTDVSFKLWDSSTNFVVRSRQTCILSIASFCGTSRYLLAICIIRLAYFCQHPANPYPLTSHKSWHSRPLWIRRGLTVLWFRGAVRGRSRLIVRRQKRQKAFEESPWTHWEFMTSATGYQPHIYMTPYSLTLRHFPADKTPPLFWYGHVLAYNAVFSSTTPLGLRLDSHFWCLHLVR